MQLVCTTFSTESWRPEAGGSEKNYGRRFEAAAGVAGAVKYTANRHTAHHYAIGGVELFLLSKGNFSLSRARLVRLHFGGCFHCTVFPMKNSSNDNDVVVPSLISRFLFLLLTVLIWTLSKSKTLSNQRLSPLCHRWSGALLAFQGKFFAEPSETSEAPFWRLLPLHSVAIGVLS